MQHINIANKLTHDVQINQNNYHGYFGPAFMNSYSREKLVKSVFANISYLSSIDTYAFSDEELPTIYNVFDSTVTLLESLTLTEFMGRFGIDDINKAFIPSKSDGTQHTQIRQEYIGITAIEFAKIKQLFEGEYTYNAPLGRKAMEALYLCEFDKELYDFFMFLLHMASRMAVISKEPNIYNEYRIQKGIKFMFYGDAESLLFGHGLIYIYSLGRETPMDGKPLIQYETEFNRGDFSSVGIFEPDGSYKFTCLDRTYIKEITNAQEPPYYHVIPLPTCPSYFVYYIPCDTPTSTDTI